MAKPLTICSRHLATVVAYCYIFCRTCSRRVSHYVLINSYENLLMSNGVANRVEKKRYSEERIRDQKSEQRYEFSTRLNCPYLPKPWEMLRSTGYIADLSTPNFGVHLQCSTSRYIRIQRIITKEGISWYGR